MDVSSRHHYIPRYYIKGFVDADGLLFVYDKIKRKIIGRKSPKSIFYEWDRNTIFNGTEKSSIIEDKIYGYVDSYCSPAFEWYRNQKNIDGIHNLENLGKLKIFAVNLYWRLPVNDALFDDYWRRTEIKLRPDSGGEIFNKDLIEEIKNDPTQKKVARSQLDNESIKEAIAQSNKEEYRNKLFDFDSTKLILGDNPVIYKVPPKTIDQIVYSDLSFAISSNRLFYETKEAGINFDDTFAYTYNAIVIDQSARYICSASEELLEKSIEHYEKIKWQQLMPFFRRRLFETK